VRAGGCPQLSEKEKQVWYLFFLIQWRRTPESQRAVATDAEVLAMLDEALAELRIALPERSAEIDALSTPEAKARTVRNVRVSGLQQFSENAMKVLKKRGIAILKIRKPNKSFIVGSRPVVKLTIAGRSDLSDPTVEMWLPIASDIAMGVGRNDGGVSLHYLDHTEPIRQLNTAIASQSAIIAAGSAALVRSLSSAR
jgi:hypothetical protein